MTWFFAVLVVLVMGGVAVVATGRGGSMAETYDDRPDALVPADGPLAARDLRRVHFSTALPGLPDVRGGRAAGPARRRAGAAPRVHGRDRRRCGSGCSGEVDVAAPAGSVWDYVTDWPRQGEWIPSTRVERVDAADAVGRPGLPGLDRDRGLAVGFWDPMTITAWQRTPDGGGLCEVLHLGAVVRGEGEFAVVALGRGPQPVRVGRDGGAAVRPAGRARAGGWPAAWWSGSSTAAWRRCATGSEQAAGRAGRRERLSGPRTPASAWPRRRRRRCGGPGVAPVSAIISASKASDDTRS